MATLRAYGTPAERAQQTQFWAQYYPSNQRANAQFDLSAWSAAQDAQYRQDQADAAAQQQDFSNRVNLSRYATGLDASDRTAAEDARRFGINTGLAERQLSAYGDERTEARNFRAAEHADKSFAALQSKILAGNVADIDEAWAYIPKTPDNVIRVSKLLDTFKKEMTQKTLEDYDKTTAGVQADQLAAIIKLKGAAITDKDKEDAMMVDPQTLALIPRTVGTVIPGARWDYDKKKWTTEPDNMFRPVMGNFRKTEDNLDLARFAPAPPRAVTIPQVSNQGGGYFPITPQPRADLSQFSTGTNAPGQRRYRWTPQGLVPF